MNFMNLCEKSKFRDLGDLARSPEYSVSLPGPVTCYNYAN